MANESFIVNMLFTIDERYYCRILCTEKVHDSYCGSNINNMQSELTLEDETMGCMAFVNKKSCDGKGSAHFAPY